MNKSLIICDRLLFGSLLAQIFFLPAPFAMIAVCQGAVAITWAAKRILSIRASSRQGMSRAFDLSAGSMIWPLLALGLLIVLTIPLSHNPSLSFKKFGTRFLYQIVLMCSVIEVVRTRKRLYAVMGMLLLMLFLVSIDTLTQYLWGKGIFHHTQLVSGRVSGPMNEPNDLGTLLVTVLPVVLTSIIACRNLIPRAGAGVISLLFLFLIAALGLTDSRGAWVAFVVSILALGCFLKRRVLVLIVLLLAVFFGIFGMYFMSTRFDRYSSPVISSGGFSVKEVLRTFVVISGRDAYWDTAIDVIKRYPWYGCGYNAYVQTLRDLRVGHEEYPHNSILHITAELGIIGMLFYIWLFVSLCSQGWRIICQMAGTKDLYALACGISCGILAWMMHSLMDTPWSSLQLGLLVWLMTGLLLSLETVLPNEGG